jgi:hypothetical protein
MLALALALAGCATPATLGAGKSCLAGATLESRAGRDWWEENRWRYASDEAASAAYRRLADLASPWPDWYQPYRATLPPGTRFQMAIGGSQTPDTPGNWGTFHRVRRVEQVREDLAVRRDWKPRVDRVVTYEVVRDLPVRIGPVGPQVDPRLCALLPGGWSQFEAMVEKGTLRSYLEVLDVRPIR